MNTMTGDPENSRSDELHSLAAPVLEQPRWIWRNGELTPWASATVHVNAVGHASVSAVFEGVKVYRADDGRRLLAFRLEDHLQRLYQSARICRLDIPIGPTELRAGVLELIRANGFTGDSYIRPWAFPAGYIREQMVPAGARCELVVDSWPFISKPDLQGCRAAVSSWLRVPDAAMPPRAKAFSNYHNGRLAVVEARQNGHDWPIMLNDRHQVSEGPGACVALVRNGVLVTPTVASGILESVTRATLLTLAADLQVPTAERDIERSELYLADEIFFLGTAWEILPVTCLDGLTVGIGTPGPVTRCLAEAYQRVIRGRSSEHPEWITEIALDAGPVPARVMAVDRQRSRQAAEDPDTFERIS